MADLQALVTAKLLAVSMLSTWGTRLNGASEAFGLVLCRKIAKRKAVYSWSVFLMNRPPKQKGENHKSDEEHVETSSQRRIHSLSCSCLILQYYRQFSYCWLAQRHEASGRKPSHHHLQMLSCLNTRQESIGYKTMIYGEWKVFVQTHTYKLTLALDIHCQCGEKHLLSIMIYLYTILEYNTGENETYNNGTICAGGFQTQNHSQI